MTPSIQSLDAVHDRLGRQFEEHQRMLIEGDLERAREILEQFARGLRAHARHEEEVLLPVYEERVPRTRIGDPDTIREEHQLIDKTLKGLESRTAELRRDDSRWSEHLLALLEDHYRFKQLLKHHNDREDRSLYPKLDEACSPDERRSLLEAGEGPDSV